MGDASTANVRSCRDDFTFLEEIGCGSFGGVNLARRSQDGLLYAIKTVKLDMLTRKDQLAAVSEAQILSSLDSPHIVKYFDSFLHEGRLHIVMEYCRGGSLHAAIRKARRPLEEDSVWRVLLHSAAALQHMHGRRMLHRDVKTMNIFLSQREEGPDAVAGRQQAPVQFKLGDVGVSKVLEEGRSHASTVIGTPFYLSPELAQELPYGPPSDMWALGVVLYECATRRHPFDSQTQAGLIMKIIKGKYEPLIGLDPELTAIIHRCLSQAAARRPSAAGLLSQSAVRAKAAELGFDLGPGLTATGGATEGRRVPRSLPSPQLTAVQPASRKLTMPSTPSPRGEHVAAAAGTQLRGSGAGADAAQPQATSQVAAGRRKPPLPPAAVPLRRRTAAAAAADQADIGASPGMESAQIIERGAPDSTPLTSDSPVAGNVAAVVTGLAVPPSRSSHFKVPQHLDAQRTSAQGHLSSVSGSGSSCAADSGRACGDECQPASSPNVQCSTGSDNSCAPNQVQGCEAFGPSSDTSQVELPLPTAAAPAVAEGEQQGADATLGQSSTLQRLRQRCVALLGAEGLFDELHGLARAAAAEDGSAGGSGSKGGQQQEGGAQQGALAALSERLFSQLGHSKHAAEVLHLLLRMVFLQGKGA